MEELGNEELGSELEENENSPDPLWKTRGFSSLEAMVAELEGNVASEKAARSVAEQALVVKPAVQSPQFDRAKYDDDPEGYSAQFNQEVQNYLASTNAPSYPASVLDGAVKGVLAEGETKAINRHVLYGVMRSLVAEDPNKKHMLDSPDGIRELGRQALEQFAAKTGEPEPDKVIPGEHVQPKGSPSGAPKKTPAKESEIEKLSTQIKEAAEAGKVGDVVKLTLQRNAAKLKKEKGVK